MVAAVIARSMASANTEASPAFTANRFFLSALTATLFWLTSELGTGANAIFQHNRAIRTARQMHDGVLRFIGLRIELVGQRGGLCGLFVATAA